MADEAVLRIKMEGDANSSQTRAGGANAPNAPAGSGPTSPDAVGGAWQKIGQSIGDVIGGHLGGIVDSIRNLVSQIGQTNSYDLLPRSKAYNVPSPPTRPDGAMGKQPSSLARISPDGLEESMDSVPPGDVTGFAESMAMSVPVIGAVVAGAMILDQAMRALAHGAVDTVSSIGRFSVTMVSASTDVAQAASLIGNTLEGVSETMFKVSAAAGMVFGIDAALFNTLADFQTQMEGMVNRFAGFGPGVAETSAQMGVLNVLNDIRRGQEAAPALNEYLIARTEVQQKFEDIKIKFLQSLAPIATEGLHILATMLPLLELLAAAIPYTTPGMLAQAAKAKRLADEAAAGNTTVGGGLTLPTDFLMNQQKTPWTGAGPEGPMAGF